MKKYILYLFALIGILPISTILCCPFIFSPEDQRPFFEQYDLENNCLTSQEKEEK